jgi:putative sterol carrier protein
MLRAMRFGRFQEAGLAAFVRRSSDTRLERTLGSGPGLRMIFAGMARRFVPAKAEGFDGEVQYELATAGGEVKYWVVEVGGGQAHVRAGRAWDPKLTLGLSLTDFVRVVGGDLHPARAIIENRLRIGGDLQLAARLAEMFGQPSGF